MNIKTNSQYKRNTSKTSLRTHSQVNIHKPTRLYTLEFEAYEKKYLFKEHCTNNINNDNNCIHFKDFIKASSKKQIKTNLVAHNSSSITAKTTKVFSGNNSSRGQSLDGNSEMKVSENNRNESKYFINEVYDTSNTSKAKSMSSYEVFPMKTLHKTRHQARSVNRLINNNDNNINNNVSKSFINVYCRIRPLNPLEQMHTNNTLCVNILSNTQLEIINYNGVADMLTQYYSFDEIFPPSTTQDEIYNKTSKSIIDSVLQGYNGTIMAYGQTSSGKTFTIQGEKNNQGIIPQAMQHVFNKISQDKDTFIITASFLEIYMERINDLFDPSRSNLHIQDDAQRKPHIIDLSTITLSSYETFITTYRKASKNRTTSLTTMNDYSSRSHSIMIVNILNKTKALHGKLFIVDLAGSEKISKTNCQGLNIEEAKLINKSLSQLGLIIKALTTNTSHIPYRSSKLTRLLAESLGGNSRTSLILTCSPSLYNINETLSTLRFGKRAKMIRNKPLINKEETKEDLKYKIELLQKELQLKNEIINSINKETQRNDNSNNISNGCLYNMKVVNSLSCEGLVSESNNWINRSSDKGGCGFKSKIFNKEVKKEIEMNSKHNGVNDWKGSWEKNWQDSFSINNKSNESKCSEKFEIDLQNSRTILSTYNKEKKIKLDKELPTDKVEFNLVIYSLLFLIGTLLLYYFIQDYV